MPGTETLECDDGFLPPTQRWLIPRTRSDCITCGAMSGSEPRIAGARVQAVNGVARTTDDCSAHAARSRSLFNLNDVRVDRSILVASGVVVPNGVVTEKGIKIEVAERSAANALVSGVSNHKTERLD